jgi:hypothetical protein
MNQSPLKLFGLRIYDLLSVSLGIISGSVKIGIVIVYLLLSGTSLWRSGWESLATSLSLIFVVGLLVLIGSLLILKGKYNLGAILILVPGVFSWLAEPPRLIELLTYYGYYLRVEGIVFTFLLVLALPIAGGALALSAKKKTCIIKGAVSRKRSYWRASFALGLASGVPNLIIGPLLLGSWPLGVLAPFLIVDGVLMVYGSFCILQKKFARGALLVLGPGLIYGFFGLSLLMGSLMALLHLGYSWIFAPSTLGTLVGLALPIASSILAIYSRE